MDTAVVSVDGIERDDFGVPHFEKARERTVRRRQKRRASTVITVAREYANKKLCLPQVKKEQFITPDDVVATDARGRMQCDVCEKWAVEKVEDGVDSAYTCKECGIVSTLQVLEQGYVPVSELTDQAMMDKRALTQNGYFLTEEDINLEHRMLTTGDKQEKKEIRKYMTAKKYEVKKQIAHINMKIPEAVEDVLKHIGFALNDKIRQRALELCNRYIKDRACTEPIRFPLTCACVTRAGMENGCGFRAWDYGSFLKEHMDEDTKAGPSYVFSRWKRMLASELELPDFERNAQLQAYVFTYANRAKVGEIKVSPLERSYMASLANYIGDAKLNRIKAPAKKKKQKKESKADEKRKLTSLSLFLNLLPKPGDKQPCAFKPFKAYLPENSQSKDECIRMWSVAATIVYVTLSTRTVHAPTQNHIEQITGVREHVLIACKKTILDVIKRAVDDYRLV